MLTFTAFAQQQNYRTEVFRDNIKSLTVKVAGDDFLYPCIELGSEQVIEIRFDVLFSTDAHYSYSIVHCNADKTPSLLLPLEYLDGFNDMPITDFNPSFNTTTQYINYLVRFPNENTQLKVSGNYAIRIYETDNPDETVLTACFSVSEPLVDIDASISGNTDIDFNQYHQQLAFTLNPTGLDVRFPQSDLKIFVIQNNNDNDIRTDLQPTVIKGKQLIYNHNRKLIFDACNEYRRFEFQTYLHTNMGVKSIQYHNPYYHVMLYPDDIRKGKAYQYDRDQNGRFFVNCKNCRNPDVDADYYLVRFSLVTEPLKGLDVYLYGDFFNNILDTRSLMEYNYQSGEYEKAVLLKQGLYNYLYAAAVAGTDATTNLTEGSYFETENEYSIFVYYRPSGARYDRLVGVKSVFKPL